VTESIHVPAHHVSRAKAILKLLVPVVLTAAATSATTTWGWIRSRTSVEEIRPLIVDVTIVAKAAQSASFSNEQELHAQQRVTLELCKVATELHAQSEVERAYGSSKRRIEYMDRSRRFYLRELERLLAEHRSDPAEALRLTRLAVWRPDRDD
jgi:hypothetical protein